MFNKFLRFVLCAGFSLISISVIAQSGRDASFVNKEEFATLNFFRENSKKTTRPNSVFLNGTEAFTIKAGERVSYKVYSEGAVSVTLIQGKTYQKPTPRANNNQALTVAKNQIYYFNVDNEGALAYVPVIEKGKKAFEEREFTLAPNIAEEDLNRPIPDMSIIRKAKEVRLKAELEKKDVAEKQIQIKKEIDSFFADLKKKSELANTVNAGINVEIKEGGMREGRPTYNLIANYTYDVTDELKVELINYPAGAYLYDTSPAAKAITQAAQLTIEKYLDEYLEAGSEINIQIIGSADSSPITRDFTYLGEFTDFSKFTYYIINDYDLSAIGELYANTTKQVIIGTEIPYTSKSLTLVKGQPIKSNETLAFLRSAGIKAFMETNIVRLKQTKSNFIHFARVAETQEAKNRKVSIQILIEDILRNK